jgi:hypothetical protein
MHYQEIEPCTRCRLPGGSHSVGIRFREPNGYSFPSHLLILLLFAATSLASGQTGLKKE